MTCLGGGDMKRRFKPWTDEEIDFLFDNHEDMTYEELAKELKRTKGAVYTKCHYLGLTPKVVKEYAMYRGDKLIAIGTAKEISVETGLSPKTIYSHASFGTRGNTTVIKLEDDGDE